MSATTQIHRTIPQLYRDCLRLIRHVSPGRTSAKAISLRTSVRMEFGKPVNDENDLESRKSNAVRALSNYMLAISALQDSKLKPSVRDFHNRSVEKARQQRGERIPDTEQ